MNTLTYVLTAGGVEEAVSAARNLSRDPEIAAELVLGILDEHSDLSSPASGWRAVEIVSALSPRIADECVRLLLEQGVPKPEK